MTSVADPNDVNLYFCVCCGRPKCVWEKMKVCNGKAYQGAGYLVRFYGCLKLWIITIREQKQNKRVDKAFIVCYIITQRNRS